MRKWPLLFLPWMWGETSGRPWFISVNYSKSDKRMRPQFKQHSVCHFALKPCISGFAFDIFQLYHSQDMSKAIGNIMFSRNIANCLHLQCFKIRNDTTQSSEAFCALCTYVNEKPFIASDCLVLPLIHVTRLNDPLLASSFSTGFFYQVQFLAKLCSAVSYWILACQKIAILFCHHFMTITW